MTLVASEVFVKLWNDHKKDGIILLVQCILKQLGKNNLGKKHNMNIMNEPLFQI